MMVVCSQIYAQTKSIHGKVTNAEGKAIAAANVIVQNIKDSTVVKAELTKDDGTFKISLEYTTDILLRATAVGYTSQVKIVPTSESSPTINFALVAEKTLKEVTVTSRKPIVEEKVDRTVFNVENSIAAAGGDALDALKKTPGVQVLRNEITIAGKSSVSVMINGKLQQLSAQDLIQLLHSIPSDNLSKIEVITSPPAKYDAEGNSGIINLVTKKNLKNGFKGSATGRFEQNSMSIPGGSTSLSYRKDKLNAFCNLNLGRIAEKYTNRTTSYYPSNRWDQTIIQYSSALNAVAQFGADYQLSDRATGGVQVTEGYYKEDDVDETTAKSFVTGNILDSVIRTKGTSHELYDGKHTINLNYEWRIDTNGKKLNVDADYYSQSMQRNRNYYTQGFIRGEIAGEGIDNKLDAYPNITIRTLKADVEWPLKVMTLSFGGKAAFVESNSDNIYKIFNGADFITDTTRTNLFSYQEQTQALYISGQKSKGKWDMQVGLRGERTYMEAYSPTTGSRNIREYTQLFPSGYLQYKINDQNTLGATYTRRISRPGYSMLNPFRFYFGSNYYSVGNPALQPSFINSAELSYRWKSKYSIRLTGRHVDNYWDRIAQTDMTTGSTILTRANIGSSWSAWLSVSGQFGVTKWWETRSSINAGYNRFSLNYYNQQVMLDGFNPWLECYNSFYLNKNKTFTAEFNTYYYAPRRKDYKLWGEMSTLDIGMKLMLMDKNLIIALYLEDLMARAYWQQTNVINGTNEYSYDNARGGRISLTYKFGNKNVKTKQSDHSNEEIQRIN
jgi:outer membrane receptor protein involved in Fe transport